jgi:hypothetical protein
MLGFQPGRILNKIRPEQRRRATMSDSVRSKEQMPARFAFLRVPLFRLLAINLAAGIAVAALLVGGLLALNPFGLRDLIFADNSPATALGPLLFGFVVTFGSAAMGQPADDARPRGLGDSSATGRRSFTRQVLMRSGSARTK